MHAKSSVTLLQPQARQSQPGNADEMTHPHMHMDAICEIESGLRHSCAGRQGEH
jgi:hypothetical protein